MTERSDRSATGLVRNLGLALASLLVTFALLELGCRITGLGRPVRVADSITNWRLQWDDPSWGSWQDDFYVLAAFPGVNSDGLYDREHTVANPEAVRRIVALGDSVSFGYGLPQEQSFPAILEALLAERDERVEVFNVALPGWSTRQQRIAYDRIARKYRPDHVLLAFCLNDVAELQNNLSRPSPALAVAWRHSHLVRALLRARDWEIHQVEELFAAPDGPAVQRGWALAFAEIAALAAAVEADGATFSLLVLPFRFQVRSDAPEPVAQRTLARFGAERGIAELDLLPALLPLGTGAFIDHDHLSAEGARRVAEAILDSGILGSD